MARRRWRRHPDSNRGIRVLQTLALPLGYAAILLLLLHLVTQQFLEGRQATIRLKPSTSEGAPQRVHIEPPHPLRIRTRVLSGTRYTLPDFV
jgi:hypothetical protein